MGILFKEFLAAIGFRSSGWIDDLRISEVIIQLYHDNVRAAGTGINLHFFGKHFTIYFVEWQNMFYENREGHWN